MLRVDEEAVSSAFSPHVDFFLLRMMRSELLAHDFSSTSNMRDLYPGNPFATVFRCWSRLSKQVGGTSLERTR